MRVVEVETQDQKIRYVVIDEDGKLVEPIVRYLKYLDRIGSARQTLRSSEAGYLSRAERWQVLARRGHSEDAHARTQNPRDVRGCSRSSDADRLGQATLHRRRKSQRVAVPRVQTPAHESTLSERQSPRRTGST